MKLEDKILKAIELGYTCDIELGLVYGLNNNVLKRCNRHGYKEFKIRINGKQVSIKEHQFIYYVKHKKCVECIDHINRIKTDNRASNLRSIKSNQNVWNRSNVKGCGYIERLNKWQSKICINNKSIYLGLYATELEARQAYLDAKKIYHII